MRNLPDEERGLGEGLCAKTRECEWPRQENIMGFQGNDLVSLEVSVRAMSEGRLVFDGFYDKKPLYPEEA